MKKTLLTLALASTALVATNAQAAIKFSVLDGPNGILNATAEAKIKGDTAFTLGSTKANENARKERTKEIKKSLDFQYKVGFEYEKTLSSFTTINVDFDYEGNHKVERKFNTKTTNGKYPHPEPLTVQTTSGDFFGPEWGDYTFTLTDTRFGTFTFSNDIDTVFSKKTKVSLNPGVEEKKDGRGLHYQSPEFYNLTVFASYNNTKARKDIEAGDKGFDTKALRFKYALPNTAALTGQEVNLSFFKTHSHKATGVAKGHADTVRRHISYQGAEINYSANIQDLKLTAAYAFTAARSNYSDAIKNNENALFFSAKYKLHQYITLTGDYGFKRTNKTKNVVSKEVVNEHLFKVSYGSNSLPLGFYNTSVEFGLGYEFTTKTITKSTKGINGSTKSTADKNKFTANVTLNLL